MKYSSGAKAALAVLHRTADADGNIWAGRALVELGQADQTTSSLAYALHENTVWDPTMRLSLNRKARTGLSGGQLIPDGQLGNLGVPEDLLIRRIESRATNHEPAVVLEVHVAQALVESLAAILPAFGVDGNALIEATEAREKREAIPHPPVNNSDTRNTMSVWPDLRPQDLQLLRDLAHAVQRSPEQEEFELWQIATFGGREAWIEHAGIEERLSASTSAVDALAREDLIRVLPQSQDMSLLYLTPRGLRVTEMEYAPTPIAPQAASPGPDVDQKLCFVLMPFAPGFAEVWEDGIKVAVAAAGLNCLRADDIYGPGVILDDIIRNVAAARLLVADLTGRNPNVFYELGYAHALRKPVVLLVQSHSDVPFDLKHFRVVEYSTTGRGLEKLRTGLVAAIRAVVGIIDSEN